MITSTTTTTTTTVKGAESIAPPDRPDKAEEKPKRELNAVKAAIEEKQQQAEEEPVVDRKAAAETVAQALKMDFPSNSALEIAVNEQDDGFVYRAVDRDTGEVLKQFPAEEVLSRLERLDRMQGLAVDGQV
jgi:flagellar protein FlaG